MRIDMEGLGGCIDGVERSCELKDSSKEDSYS
jgi:hypothetical protein